MMFDACVLGHITKDIIRVDDKVEREMPGGTVYYTSMALRSLGLRVAAVTKVSRQDRDSLLHELEETGISVFCIESEETTVFENIYAGESLDPRVQRVRSVASPFLPVDLPEITAAVFHVGPLTNMDVSVDLLREISLRGDLVSLDVQGLLRKITHGEIREEDWQEKEKGLVYVDILKADEKEATILSGENDTEKAARRLSDFGPQEIVITCGSRGALIFAKGEFHRIPALHARIKKDPTGCGDTFVAGYVYQRLRSGDFIKAGRLAAFLASLKLEKFGAVREIRAEQIRPYLFGQQD